MPGLDTVIAPRSRRVVALLAVLALTLAVLGGCSDDNGGGNAIDVTPDPDTVKTSEVVIQGRAFEPKSITLAAANVVQWTNRDFTDPAAAATGSPDSIPSATEHTVTADDGAFDSGPLGGEATFAFTFLEPGTYKYHCEIHKTMTGTVKVT